MERLIIILALVSSTLAGPIVSYDRDTCSRTCTDSNKFGFVPGRTYEYDYEAGVRTEVRGSSSDHSALTMRATVQLEILSKCEHSLRLKNVKLLEYDPETEAFTPASEEFSTALEQIPVRLSYQDGTITDVCLSENEPAWVMNTKRGIISLLQNNMEDFKKNHTISETDVSGVCDTDYSVGESSYFTTKVTKTKNLLGCTDRHRYNTAIQGMPYTSQSSIQSLPLLRSNHSCEHEISTGGSHLTSVSCQEEHVFRPFSTDNSGVTTVTTQTLKYVTMTTGTRSPAPIRERVSLKFEHEDHIESEGRSRKEITRKLMEICEKTKAGVRPETPRLFTDLVYLVKMADKDTLTDVYRTLSGDALCPDNKYTTSKFFTDSLPMAGTSASLGVMTDMISAGQVSATDADMWITSLNFIKHPTQDMLRAVKPLINMEQFEGKAMLSVGTLVHSYCYHHGNCQEDTIVKAIVSTISNKIAGGCKVNDDNMKTTLYALRGLGNAGWASSAVPGLEQCMGAQSNPIEIRLSAIEAFRRMPCTDKRRGIMNILQNREEDSELRIAAYRVLMECPSDLILAFIKDILANEEVNQVGSYIWTHLTNLMETSDRHKQDIRALLEDKDLKKEFNMDKRKFSRNYEGSFFIEKFNTGAKVEGDLIWSQKSFVPRSAAVNLTFDLFGHSVNLFELGGRAEGLEYFLEAMLGPNGYFGQEAREETPSTDLAIKNTKMDKIEKMDKRMGVSMSDLRGSMYMRMFGNELRYSNFHGLEDLLSSAGINIPELIIKLAQDNDYSYSHSTMFMDSSFIVPTSTGFPLNLTVNGSATVDLKMSGKMNLKQPPSLDINGRIQPSAAVDISSMMSVDAHVTRTGLKMVSTLHTSTAVAGSINVDPSGSISAQYDLPEDRLEIVDVQSSFFTIHRNGERKQNMITDNRRSKNLCTPDQVTTVMGVSLCLEVAYPNATLMSDAPHFPLTGPVSAGVYLYKDDSHTSYKFAAKSKHDANENIVRVMFDTPGSRTDRHLELDVTLNKRDMDLSVTLTSPWKQANMQGSLIYAKKEVGVRGKLAIDGKLPYSLTAGISSDVTGNTVTYTPSLEVMSPSQQPIKIEGVVSAKGDMQFDAMVDVTGILKDPFSAQMTLHNKIKLVGFQGSVNLARNQQYALDATIGITSYKKKTLYKPLVSLRTPTNELLAFGGTLGLYDNKVDFNLVLDKIVQKSVTLKGALVQMVKKGGRVLYRTNLNFASSPADFRLIWKVDNRNYRVITNDFDFTYVIRQVARNSIKIVSKVINQSGKTLSKGKANMNVVVKRNPELNFKVLAGMDHNAKHSQFDFDLVYGKDFKDENKHVDISIEMNRKGNSLDKASGEIKSRIRIPAMDLTSQFTAQHSHILMEHFNTSFMVKSRGQSVSGSVSMMDKSTKELVGLYGDLQLSLPSYDIGLEHIVQQEPSARSNYVSTINAQFKKGQKNTIVTTYADRGSTVAITSRFNLFGQAPAKLAGEFGFGPSMVTIGSFEKDGQRYFGSLRASDDENTNKLSLEVETPGREAAINLMGKMMSDMYSIDADAMWKSLNENRQRASMQAWMEPPAAGKFNGSITTNVAARNVTLNVHHQTKAATYITHADLLWEPKKMITADTTFELQANRFASSVLLTTPFVSLPTLKVDFTHDSNMEEYKTNAVISWDETISFESVLKKPISLKTLVATVDLDTTFKAARKANIFINHKMSKSIASEAKFSLNKQLLNFIVTVQNTTKGRKVGYTGTVDIKSSMKNMKKGKLMFSHDNDGRTFNTMTSFLRNRQEYKLDSKVTHVSSDTRLDNSGSLILSIPNSKTEVGWNHRHSNQDIATTFTATQDKNILFAMFNRNVNDKKYTTGLEVQTALKNFGSHSFNFSSILHMDKNITAGITLLNSERSLGSASLIFTPKPQDKGFYTAASLAIPDLDVNSIISLEGTDGKDANINFLVDISPKIRMNLRVANALMTNTHLYRSTMVWTSTLPGYEEVMYTYEIFDEMDILKTITTLEYSSGKVIKLATTLKIKNKDYHTSGILTTPFSSLPRMSGEISFVGSPDAFKSDASLEILPSLSSTKVTVHWSSKDGIASMVRLDMPIPEHPYVIVDVNGRLGTDFVSSDLHAEVTYSPSESVKAEFSHAISNNLVSAAKVSGPFGTGSLSIDGSPARVLGNVGIESSLGRKYGVDILYNNKKKLDTTVTLTQHGKRDIILYVSHSGKATDFTTNVEIKHNKKNNFESDIKFQLTEGMFLSAKGALRTELISDAESYESSFNLESSQQNVIISGDFTNSSQGKTSFDASLDITQGVQGYLAAVSPVFRNIRSSFSHVNQGNFIQSKADFTHGGQKKLDVSITFSNAFSTTGEISVKTFKTQDLDVKTQFDGHLDDFVFKTDASYGTKKGLLEVTQTMKPKTFHQTISIKATGLDDLSTEISHNGDLNQLRSFVEMNAGNDRHRLDATYSHLREGSISLSSPLTSPIIASFLYQREQSQAKTHAELQFGADKSNLDLHLKSSPLEASLSLNTPYTKDVSLFAQHLGSFPNINSEAKLSIEGEKDNGIKLTVRKAAKCSASLELSTMFTEDLETSASFENNKASKTVDMSAKYSYGTKTSAADVTYSYASGHQGHLSVTSHLMPTLTAGFTHEGNMDSFKTHAQYLISTNKSEVEVFFNSVGKYEGLVSLRSHLTPDISMGFGHRGSMKNFACHGEFSIAGDKTEADISVNMETDVSTGLTLRLPGKDDMTAKYTHTGTLQDFACHAEFDMGEKWESDLSFSSTNNVQGKFSLSPPTYVSPVQAEFSLSGKPADFNGHAEITRGEETSSSDILFKLTSDEISTSFKLNTPHMANIDTSLNLVNGYGKYSVEAGITVNENRNAVKATLNTDFDKRNKRLNLDGAFKLTSPLCKNIDSTYKFSLNPKMSYGWINNQGRTWMMFSYDVENIKSIFKVELRLWEPHFSVYFTNNQTLSTDRKLGWNGRWEVYLGENQYYMTTVVSESNLDVLLGSPIYADLFIKLTGKARNFNGFIKLLSTKRRMYDVENSLTVSLNFDNIKSIKGSFEVKSPYIQGVKGDFIQTIDKDTYKLSESITMDEVDWLSSSVQLVNSADIMKADIEVNNGALYKVVVTATNKTEYLELNGLLTLGSDTSSMSTVLHYSPMEVSFNLETPYIPDIRTSMALSGTLSNFLGQSELYLDDEKQGTVQVRLNTATGLDASFTVDLPTRNDALTGSLRKSVKGSLNEVSGSLLRKTQKLVDIDLKYDIPNMLIDFSGMSAKPHKINAKYHFTLSERELKTNWQFQHIDSDFTGDVQVTPSKQMVKVSIDSDMADLDFSFDHSDSKMTLSNTLLYDRKTWTSESSLSYIDSIDGKFMVISPDRDPLSGSFLYSHNLANIASEASFNWNNTIKYGYNISLVFNTGFTGYLTVSTPFDGYTQSDVTVYYKGSLEDFSSSAQVNFGGKGVTLTATMNPSGGDVTFKSPFERLENIEVSYYSNINPSQMQVGGKVLFAVGEQVTIDIEHEQKGLTYESKVSLFSPFTDKVELTAIHSGKTGDLTDLSAEYSIKVGDNSVALKSSLQHGQQFLTTFSSLNMIIDGRKNSYSFELKHNGEIKNFKTEITMKQNRKEEVRVDVAFHVADLFLDTSVNILSPLSGYEDLKASLKFSANPQRVSSNAALSRSGSYVFTHDIDVSVPVSSQISASWQMRTPATLNKITYKHSGHKSGFECEMGLTALNKNLMANLEGTYSPPTLMFNADTPFDGYEKIGFTGIMKNGQSSQYSGSVEASWNLKSKILLDGSISLEPFDVSASLSTPFTAAKMVKLESSHKEMAKGMMETLKIVHNSKPLIDIDFEHTILGQHKQMLVTVRSPRPVVLEIDGDFTLQNTDIEGSLLLDQDNANKLKLEAGYDVRSNYLANFKASGQGQVWSFDGLASQRHSKADIMWGQKSTQKAGYEITWTDRMGNVKVILPSRSLVVSGSYKGRVTEGEFMWNADVDRNSKVGFRSLITPTADSVKADITVFMPSIGKEVTLGSEVVVKRGRIIFEGRTELSYSPDSRKNIVISSKLEDISQGSGSNYSFSVGVSHPYTTVDVQVASHLGQSPAGYSAGIGVEYMAVSRQTKTFLVGGAINKLRKSVSLELKSPVKSVSISGSAQTGDKFRVSLLNVYDNKRPLSTVFTVDPTSRAIDFMMNYKLDQPNNEFHIRANYVNSSAVQAEMWHETQGSRVQDALVTVRLNNSHLIHSRIHWRPEMIQNLEAFRQREAQDYSQRIERSVKQIHETTFDEVVRKFHLVWSAVGEEIGEGNVVKFERIMLPVLDQALQIYVNISQPVYQQMNAVILDARSRYSSVVSSYKAFMDRPLVNMNMDSQFNEDVFANMRRNISDNFNFVSDKLWLPSQYLPSVVSQAIDSTMPRFVSQSQIETVSSVAQMFTKSMIQEWTEELEETLRKVERIILSNIKSPVTVWDPAHGEIQLEQYLLVPLSSLDTIPGLHLARYVEKLEGLVPEMPDITLPDIYGEWIPPFTATATISKGQRVTTYDGFVYDLDSECTYLLARDFHSNNFTIVLSNDGDRTLSVVYKGQPISVNIEGQVQVGEEPLSLPAVIGGVDIQESANVITLTAGNHFTVIYDTTVDHITVRVSGWYFGKMSGLLGLYDNEPSNDLMTSFNRVVDSPARFIRTWNVASQTC
ncbi:uncharacterized protein LOC128213563 isoform X2 [Mya arenaria]|uniref:uncharacterized protein LOC128213563 isoform X2 n=1 Tax=Mya arenaria TaxID=6604 RepID=UPI0022E9135C|nr:uncharacterized protein LOC128213563 isoform X2 [Mya arenaria]